MEFDADSPGPLYAKVEEDLKQKILSGDFRIGQKLGSHRQLADQYNVSLITIKQALKHLREAGYVHTYPGKGTFVARTTRPIDHHEHLTIGLIISKLDDIFFSSIVEAIEKEAYDAGFNILLSMSASRLQKGSEQVDRYRAMGVDGLIIASLEPTHEIPEFIDELHASQFPYVIVSYVKYDRYYSVNTNQEEGAYLGAGYLLQMGYRRIGYVGTSLKDLLNRERHHGYRRALREYDAYDETFVYDVIEEGGWKRYPYSVQAGKFIADLPDRPQALVAYNDLVAVGLQTGLRARGLKLPETIAIVGFDGVDLFRNPPFSLTTVVQPVDEIGKQAVRVLTKRIHKEPVDRRTLLPPKMHIGNSSGRG